MRATNYASTLHFFFFFGICPFAHSLSLTGMDSALLQVPLQLTERLSIVNKARLAPPVDLQECEKFSPTKKKKETKKKKTCISLPLFE